MATDLERLVVQLSADIKSYERAVGRAVGLTNKQMGAIERRASQMNKRLDSIFSKSFNGLTAPLAGVGAAFGAKQISDYADAWTVAGNKIAAASQIAGRQGRSLEGVNEIANRTRSSLESTTDLYAKLLRSTGAVASSEEEVARATEIVNKAFKAGGAATSEQTAGILQLSQALGSGLLQGDELRSLRENAPLIAQAIADEFKTTIAGLKQLGADGELTTDRVFKAILSAQPKIEAAFSKTNSTIADGITRVNNAFTQYIGQTDSGLGASQRLVAGLTALADNFDNTADIVLKLASVIAGALVGRSIVGMIRSLGLATNAVVSLVGALRTASSMSGLLAAFGGLGAAAGPLGMVIGSTVVGALALFASSSSEASAAAKTYADALAEVEAAANRVPSAVEGAATKISEKTRNVLMAGVAEGVNAIDEARAAVEELFDFLTQSVEISMVSEDQLRQLRELKERFDDGSASAEETQQALYGLANSNPDFQEIADRFEPLLTTLRNAIAATDLLKTKLADVPSGPSFRTSEIQSMSDYEELKRAGNAFVKEAERRNALSKEQLALEEEIAKVKKAADKEGAALTEKQIKAIAEANIAADERRSQESKKPKKTPSAPRTAESRFNDDIQTVRDRTAALIQEAQAVGLSYREQEKRRMALDLEQAALADLREEARKKGQTDFSNIKLTEEQIAKIDAVSAAYAKQADELRKVQEAQDRAEQAASDFYESFKDGVLDAITGAESLSDALSGVLKKLSEMLLNSAFDALFKPSSGGSTGGTYGGILGSLGKLLGFNKGGVVHAATGGQIRGPGGPRSDSIPARLSDGEFVVNAAATKRNLKLLNAINSGKIASFADGGPVIRAPMIPRLLTPANNNSPNITFAPVIDARGADSAAVARLEQVVAKQQQEFQARVVHTVRQAQKTRNL